MRCDHPIITVENPCYTAKGGYIVSPAKKAVNQVEVTALICSKESHKESLTLALGYSNTYKLFEPPVFEKKRKTMDTVSKRKSK